MTLLSRIRRWVEEEKRYLWIVIALALFHALFSILGAHKTPLEQGMALVAEEEGPDEEAFLSTLRENPSLHLLVGFGTLLVLFLLSIGLVFSVRLLWLGVRGRISVPWRVPEQTIGWTIRDVFHVVVLLLLSMVCIEFFQALFFHLFPTDRAESLRLVGGTFLMDVAVLILILHLVRLQKKQNFLHLGLTTAAFFRNFLFGIKNYLVLLPLLFYSLLFSLWVADFLQFSPPPQPLHTLLQEERVGVLFFFLVSLVVLWGPMIEEVFFRGFLYNALKVRWGRGWAALFSGSLFAILHANWIGFLPITLLGLLLAYSYEWTGSLIASMAIHILHNSLILGLFFLTAHFSQLSGTVFFS